MRALSLRSALAAATLLVLPTLAAPATAQLGGLLKKAVASKLPPTDPPVFDNLILELTPARIDKIILAHAAGLALSKGPNGPAALQDRMYAADEKLGDFTSKNAKVLNAYATRLAAIEQCRRDALGARRNQLRQQSTSNPEFMRKAAEFSQAVALAQQKGDTALVRTLQEAFKNQFEPTHDDSMAVDQKCGTAVPTAEVAQAEAMKQARDLLEQQMRAAEAAVSAAEQQTSGMTATQYYVALERIEMWRTMHASKAGFKGYTQAELDALEARLKDLKNVKR